MVLELALLALRSRASLARVLWVNLIARNPAPRSLVLHHLSEGMKWE